MKRRVRKIANFFAFNLLFFALYLNFIHKDKVTTATATEQTAQQNTAAFSGTVLVDNPEKYLGKKNEGAATITAPQQSVVEKTTDGNTAALKLSIN
jgi:hypothetical protein